MSRIHRPISFLIRCAIPIFLFFFITPGFGIPAQKKGSDIRFEGELKSIKEAGFTYDEISSSSGNPDADRRVKEVIDFVNSDQFVGTFSISMKFAFLNDQRITDQTYTGNGFYVLGKTSDGLPSGTVYLTTRLINRTMETHKDLLYVLALHECGHIWQHWVIIRNGNDEDDPEMRQKFGPKDTELGADAWAGGFVKRFLAKKYADSPERVDSTIKTIVAEYFDRGGYFVFDKTLVTDNERKEQFLKAFNNKQMPR